ncbi:MAG: site-specific integrase, partial [Candidatus Dormibacteraceae bacterium]
MGIGKLGDGRYRIFIDQGRGSDGRRIQHTEVFRGSRKATEIRERELLRERDNGTNLEAHKLTVAEFMAKWLKSVQNKVSWNTYRIYEQQARTHIVPDLGHVKLRELTPLVVEQVESQWLQAGNRRTGGPLDPQTVQHMHRMLHAAMGRAVKWRLLSANPIDGVEPPHVPRKEAGFLTAEESERVVMTLVNNPYELPILVGLYCGLRPAEYLALRWRDLDFLRRELHVVQNVHRVRQDEMIEYMGRQLWGFRFGPAKTHRSKRPVSIPDVVVKLLQDWAPKQSIQKQRSGGAWVDLDLIFTDARGYPHNHDRVRRAFYKVLKQAEIRQVVLYALRHTMATLVLHETKDVKLVATRLGHANETMVLRTYGHLLPGV